MVDSTNELKLVSVQHMEQSVARALSELIGRDYTVMIRDMEYKSEGAWIQLEVSPDLSRVLMRSMFDESQ